MLNVFHLNQLFQKSSSNAHIFRHLLFLQRSLFYQVLTHFLALVLSYPQQQIVKRLKAVQSQHLNHLIMQQHHYLHKQKVLLLMIYRLLLHYVLPLSAFNTSSRTAIILFHFARNVSKVCLLIYFWEVC